LLDLSASRNASEKTIVRTSLKVGSRRSAVRNGSFSFNFVKRGMEIAGETPARIAPSKSESKTCRCKTIEAVTATIAKVPKKLVSVSRMALFKACRRLEKFSPSPASNNRMTRVSVVKTGPTAPKDSGLAKWKTGPIKRPRPMRGRTSGIRFFSKMAAKRCARKIRAPPPAMATDVRIFALLKTTENEV
jgi:hypothetical protein